MENQLNAALIGNETLKSQLQAEKYRSKQLENDLSILHSRLGALEVIFLVTYSFILSSISLFKHIYMYTYFLE